MKLELPPLPFDVAALEPHMSRKTLEFHHGKHHKKYVETTQELIAGTELEKADLETIVRTAHQKGDKKLFHNAAQAWNHSFFWNCLTPSSGEPQGALADRIKNDLGGIDKFKEAFAKEATEHFASGWAWLIVKDGKLTVTSYHDADTPLVHEDVTPLLTCDVWEHAYYLDYQNERPTAGTSAGKFEVAVLAAEARAKIATRIVGRVLKLNPSCGADCNVIVVSESATLNFDQLTAFNIETESILRELRRANTAAINATNIHPDIGGTATSFAAVATGIAIIGNLLRTEYKIDGVDVTADHMLLAKQVVHEMMDKLSKEPSKKAHFIVPELSQIPIYVSEEDPIATQIKAIEGQRGAAASLIVKIGQKLADDATAKDTRDKAIADAKTPEEKTAAEKEAKAKADIAANKAADAEKVDKTDKVFSDKATAAVTDLKAAIKSYDDYIDKASKADDKGAIPLAQARAQADLKARLEKGYLLILKENAAGGSTYTAKNFWTFLGSMPYYLTGGSLGSYAVVDPKNGLLDAGYFADEGPFEKIHKVNKRLQAGVPAPPPSPK